MRATLLDARSGPFTNLFSAASFDTPGAPVVVRTNILTNPAPISTSSWSATGSTISYAAGEITVTTSGATANEGVIVNTPTDATARPNVSGGIWVQAPAGTLLYVQTRANGNAAGAVTTNFTATGAYQYVKAENASSATGAAAHLLMVRTQTVQVVTFKVKQAAIELSPIVGAYFDGATQPVIATNLARNPNANTAGSGFNNNNAAIWTSTRNVPVPAPHPQGIATCTSSMVASGQSSILILSVYNIDALVNTGPARTVGAWFYASASGYQARILSNTPVDLIANTWTWVTGQVAAGAYSSASIGKITGSAGASDIGYITGVTVFEGTTAPSYTIGGGASLPPGFASAWTGTAYQSSTIMWDSDFTPRWTGAANASTSELRGDSIPGASMSSCVAVRSTRWAKDGTYSMRLIANGPTANSYVYFNKTGPVTGVATVHLEAPLTEPVAPYSRALRINGGTVPQAQAPNLPGDYDLRVYQPDPSVNAAMIFGHGGRAGTSDVWWDAAGLFYGQYYGPWIPAGTSYPA